MQLHVWLEIDYESNRTDREQAIADVRADLEERLGSTPVLLNYHVEWISQRWPNLEKTNP